MSPGNRISKFYQEYISSSLLHCGSVFRSVNFVSDCKDDIIFLQFCRDVLGFDAADKWPDYGRAVPNEGALMPSLIKYDKPIYEVDKREWNVSMEWCLQHFRAASGSEELTADEQVFELMDKTSSCGYPFNMLPGKGKMKVIGDKELMEVCYAYNEKVLFKQTPTLWAVHEKEEIRSWDKLYANRIRTFVGCSIEFLFSCMTMFYIMNEKLYKSAKAFQNWSFVGATKFYGGWNKLFKRLSKHPNAFELDEVDYDCSLIQFFMESMMYIRRSFIVDCTDTQWTKIKNLYWEIIFSFMVTPWGDVLQKFGGNPSGSYNTITDNTLILFMLLCYAFLKLVPDEYKTYKMFMKHVSAVLCGDDNTWTVSDELLPYFNARSVAFVWSNLGIRTKTDCWEPRDLIDCSFMSMNFVRVKHFRTGVPFVVPVPETSKIMGAMAFNLKFNHARWSLLRAAALRIESYYNMECRQYLWSYINFLELYYAEELHSPCDNNLKYDFLTYEDVISVIKTDSEIESLYGEHLESSGFNFSDKIYEALSEMGLQLKF